MISSLSPVPSLPEPLGPHTVGTTEWEIPIAEIPSPTPVPDAHISTLKFRIFYPTLPTANSPDAESWLPQPQRAWSQAYASFLGASPKLSSWVAHFLFFLHYIKMPAIPEGPLLPRDRPSKYPVVVFSHGLGGNFNTYSAICASLASFGIVCVAPEHRDGSAPVTFIRSADGSTTSIGYQRYPHTPTRQVLASRNAQLRIRVWELEHLYTVLTSLNSGGEQFSNYATRDGLPTQSDPLSWTDKLDLRPGRVTWAGHSFGACSIVQFVKSVYYHQSFPSLQGTPYENDLDWRPLYKPASNLDLVRQITPGSPIALLDLWAMPLRAEQTRWLWEKPLPCYDQDTSSSRSGKTTPTVVAVVTAEFHKHAELLNRMRAALSPNPAEAITKLEDEGTRSDVGEEREELTETTALSMAPCTTSPQANADVDVHSDSDSDSISASPNQSSASSPHTRSVSSRMSSPAPGTADRPSPASSTTSVSFSPSSGPDLGSTPIPPVHPKLYLVPSSAHLSQSDFGLLFPRLIRYLTKAEDPEEIIALNVRAILSMMRGAGLELEPFKASQRSGAAAEQKHAKDGADEDDILTQRGKEQRFVPVPLVG